MELDTWENDKWSLCSTVQKSSASKEVELHNTTKLITAVCSDLVGMHIKQKFTLTSGINWIQPAGNQVSQRVAAVILGWIAVLWGRLPRRPMQSQPLVTRRLRVLRAPPLTSKPVGAIRRQSEKIECNHRASGLYFSATEPLSRRNAFFSLILPAEHFALW